MGMTKVEAEEMMKKMMAEMRMEFEPDPDLTTKTILEQRLADLQTLWLKELTKMKVEILEEMADGKGKGKEGKGSHRMGLTSRREFNSLPSYEGKHETYDNWKYKLKRFLNEDMEIKELMVQLEKVKMIPSKEDVLDLFELADNELLKIGQEKCDRYWINQQLFQVLSMNLEGKALASVKNLDTIDLKDTNGIIGWCKLAQDCTAMTAQRLQGLAGKVYGPKRVKKYREVMGALEEWELNATLFETTEDRKLSNQTKIYSIRQLVPEELDKDITKASPTMTSYDAVRAYITEQVTVRRDIKQSSSGPVTMDVNYVKKTLAAMVEDETYGEHHDEEDKGAHEGGEYHEEDEEKTAIEYLMSFVKGY